MFKQFIQRIRTHAAWLLGIGFMAGALYGYIKLETDPSSKLAYTIASGLWGASISAFFINIYPNPFRRRARSILIFLLLFGATLIPYLAVDRSDDRSLLLGFALALSVAALSEKA